mgnify:CR=1 FL=1
MALSLVAGCQGFAPTMLAAPTVQRAAAPQMGLEAELGACAALVGSPVTGALLQSLAAG